MAHHNIYEEFKAAIYNNLGPNTVSSVTKDKLLRDITAIANRYIDNAYEMGYKDFNKMS
jgi:hypothetical protein